MRSIHFDQGDLFLVLLPVAGKPLQCKYEGRYKIVRQLGPVDYITATPDKRKTERTYHVDMLRRYVQRQFQLIIIIIIICTFLYRRKVVTSEAVAEQVKSLVSVIKQVSFKPRFEYR